MTVAGLPWRFRPGGHAGRGLPTWAQRCLAAGLTLALPVLASVLSPSWLSPWLFAMGPAAFIGLLLLGLAAVLRPWRLLQRLWQPLAPRHAAMALLQPGLLVLRQRDALVQALVWTAALTTAFQLSGWLLPWLELRLDGTVLAGRAALLGWALLAALLLPPTLWLHGLPRRWALARLQGRCDGRASSDALALAADLMLLLPLLALLIHNLLRGIPLGPTAVWQLPVCLGWWAVHAGIRQLLASPAPAQLPLWLVLLPPPAPEPAGTPQPVDASHTLLALAHQLAGRWSLGPVTVLLPDDLPAGGEHLHAAQLAGQAAALFPTLPVQLADWQRSLPPADRWAALPLRELHLPRRWMAGAAAQLLQPADRLLVLAAPQASPAAVAAWQPLLQGRPGRVFQPGPAASGAAGEAPGPLLADDERRTARLAAAAQDLLLPLRPLLPQRPLSDAPARPAAAGTAATALPAGLGLPAEPRLARLAVFITATALLLLGGFAVLQRELGAQRDALAARYATLRLPAATTAGSAAAAPGPATAATGAASAALDAALRAALAPDLDSGLLRLRKGPGAAVLSLPADSLFAPGSSALNDSAVPLLQRVAAALAALGGTVDVTGHTDNQPLQGLRAPSNQQLSLDRAKAVAARLAERMDPSRVRAAGRGDAEPLAPNDTPANRAANRRMDIALQLPAPSTTTAPPVSPAATGTSATPANTRTGTAAPGGQDTATATATATASTLAPDAPAVRSTQVRR